LGPDPSRTGPSVKICGLTRREDAELAGQLGADYLGFVLSAGFARTVHEEDARSLTEGLATARVAVLVDEPVARAAAMARAIDADVIQLHGSESPEVVERLRESGDWRLWKAVRARGIEDVARAVLHYGAIADGLLVEGWKEGVMGGGGVTLALGPESVRATLPEGLTFVLAGGLTPESVGAAIEAFRPGVVDVSSGVEGSPGVKDAERMRRFLLAARDVQPESDP
jgi:phosphoribosylanthranilate isomerase